MGQLKVRIVTPSDTLVSWIEEEQTVWDALVQAGIWSMGDCGGRGVCGKCKVKVAGEISQVTREEEKFLTPEELALGYRLACSCRVKGETTVEFSTDLVTIGPGLLLPDRFHDIDPEVRVVKGYLPAVDREHPVPLLERIKETLNGWEIDISPANLNELSHLEGTGGIEVSGALLGPKVVRIKKAEEANFYGLALDIGTTTLGLILVDLREGRVIGLKEKLNSQVTVARDVLSRISYAVEKENGLWWLHQKVKEDVSELGLDMLALNGLHPEDVVEMVVVGNPVMLHLFLGADPSGLGRKPYIGLFQGQIITDFAHLGLPFNPSGRVMLLPQVGSFLGADLVACLLAVDLEKRKGALLLDLGTNGEMVLNHEGKMLACSVPAGPVFEGGNTKCGMIATNGAIDSFWLEDGRICYTVLGQKRPLGICGTGFLDLLSLLKDLQVLDDTGLINPENYPGDWTESEQGIELVIVDLKDSGNNRPIVITQEDVRQLQLAKGAVRAGVEILMKEAKLSPADIREIFIAGAFGNRLRPQSLLNIGMLPPVEPSIIKAVGNAALRGAAAALVYRWACERAILLAENVKIVELAETPEFASVFIQSMSLG